MRSLLGLILKYGGFLSFLGFEVICFWLIINYNSNQRVIWMNSSNYFSGVLYEKADDLSKYWNISAITDSLSNENARLRAELRSARFQENILEGSASNDKWQQQYIFTAAEVVDNSVNQFNNYLLLNRGKRHGINKRMAVISDQGIVGTVVSVGEYYSSVMSILHKESRIAVGNKRSNAFGSLVWQYSDPSKAQVKDIPKHTSIEIGDTIQTNGYSAIFPGGIEVGVIEDFTLRPGSNFYDIEIKLFCDLSTLKYVYVVNNLMKKEIEAMEGQDDE